MNSSRTSPPSYTAYHSRSPPPNYQPFAPNSYPQAEGWHSNRRIPRTYHIPNYAPVPDETTFLYPVNGIQRKRTSTWTYILVALAIINVLALTVVLFEKLQGTLSEVPGPDDMERHRKQWERERQEHQREHERWEREHDREEEENRRREQGGHKEDRSSLYWEKPAAGAHCAAYGTRAYTARIWNIPLFQDWMAACKQTPIVIHGKTIQTPTRCEDRGLWGGMHGFWLVDFDEIACLPLWGDFVDKGCTAKGSGLRRTESRLWNIQQGEDWKQLCTTTPVDLHGVHFDKPKYCDDKGIWGIYGTWESDDPNC